MWPERGWNEKIVWLLIFNVNQHYSCCCVYRESDKYGRNVIKVYIPLSWSCFSSIQSSVTNPRLEEKIVWSLLWELVLSLSMGYIGNMSLSEIYGSGIYGIWYMVYGIRQLVSQLSLSENVVQGEPWGLHGVFSTFWSASSNLRENMHHGFFPSFFC